LGRTNNKFAAKFAEAGNLKLRHVSQFLDSQLPAAALQVVFSTAVFRSLCSRAIPKAKSTSFGRFNCPKENPGDPNCFLL
jgi:hypothetical protein